MIPSKLVIITDPFVDATERKLLTRTTFVFGVITLLVLNQLFMFAIIRSPLSSSSTSSSTIFTGLVWNVDNDPESSNEEIHETRNDNNHNNESPPSWLRNASAGIPKSDMGQLYISFGICCYQQAQRDTQNEYDTISHNHGEKRYDKAAVMAADLWKLKEPTANVVVTLAYVGTDPSSIQQLRQVKTWLHNVGAQVWEYDVSQFQDPSFACVRVAQMGRLYLFESGIIKSMNDFVMISDADVFPINTTDLLQYLSMKNLDGDHYRVTVRDFHSRVKPDAKFPSIRLFGVGQTLGDWQRSFEITGLPTLKDAVNYAYMLSQYTWGTWFADQTIFTYALMNSELCSFPSDYIFWESDYQGRNDLLKVVKPMPPINDDDYYGNSNSTTVSSLSQQQKKRRKRDEYTCFKQTVPYGVCFEKYENETGYCTWAHFSAKATEELLFTVYKAIADDIPGVQRPKTTLELFGE